VEHLADEFDGRWLIRVLLLKMHYESKGSILKGRVGGSYYDRIPVKHHGVSLECSTAQLLLVFSLPSHDIIGDRGSRDSGGRICLHAFEVSHQSPTGGGTHGDGLKISKGRWMEGK
jgi:hypothetical protein